MKLPLLLFCAYAIGGAQPRPAFEVVSIKPVPRPTPETVRNGTSRIGFTIDAPRVEIMGYGLNVLIARAFRVEVAQVDLRGLGGEQSFAVQAKLPENATREQVPEMLQTMLDDRFKLAYHRESRDYPMTVVSIGKSGMKFDPLPPGTKEATSSKTLSDGTIRETHIGTIASLFPVMGSFGQFPQMVNETGLDATYTWTREQLPTAPGISFFDRVHESFQSMLEAAGLKLDARKIAKETIVVDRVQSLPTEN